MTLYQLFDLSLSLSNRIDTHWALFISVHLALVGGIIYVDRPLFVKEKAVAIIVYSGFALLNYFLMRNQTYFLETLYQQIATMKDDPCCVGNLPVQHILQWTEQKGIIRMIDSIFYTHLIMYVLLVISIVYDKPLTEKKQNNKEGE
jgi:hypothetical protein